MADDEDVTRARRRPSKNQESDDDRAERYAEELKAHHDGHAETVASIHEAYPVPATSFPELSESHQQMWNLRREALDQANKKYFRAVTETCTRHRQEQAKVIANLRAKDPTEEAA